MALPRSVRPHPLANRCGYRAGRPADRRRARPRASCRDRDPPPRRRKWRRRDRPGTGGTGRLRSSHRRCRRTVNPASRPSAACIWLRTSSPITHWKSRTRAGVGVRPGGGTDAIERIGDIGYPVAQRLVHCVLERAGARCNGHNCSRRAYSSAAHSDFAVPHRRRPCRRCIRGRSVRTGGRRSATPCWPAPVSAMMRRLTHAPREQDLPQHIVDLVRAGMVQIFALEVDLGTTASRPAARAIDARMRGQPLGEIERARPSDVMGEQMPDSSRAKAGIGLGFTVANARVRG